MGTVLYFGAIQIQLFYQSPFYWISTFKALCHTPRTKCFIYEKGIEDLK